MGFHLLSYLQGVAHDPWWEGHSVCLSGQAGHPQLAWVMKQVCKALPHVTVDSRLGLRYTAIAVLLASVACEKFRTSTVHQHHLFHFCKVPSVGILWPDVICFLFYTEPPFKKSYEYMGPQK